MGFVHSAGGPVSHRVSLSSIDANLVQAACEERARDEAERNDPQFAEYIASAEIDMSDVSIVLASIHAGTDTSWQEAVDATERIIADYVSFRVGSMPAWERTEIQHKVLD